MRRIERQRDAGADTDLENAAAEFVGGLDRGVAALGEHAAEHEIVDRRPTVVSLLDHVAVEIQVPCIVKLHRFCHGNFHYRWRIISAADRTSAGNDRCWMRRPPG